MAEWKDTSHFSGGDVNRVPNEFTIESRRIKIVLHHYVGNGEAWFVSSYPDLVRQRQLFATDIESAKVEALCVVREVLEEILGGLNA